MTTQPPLLSVLIHGPMDEALLAKAIESVNTQNIAHLELIIGDNIAAAQGKYIAFLATTDLFEPGALKTRLNYLLSNPDTDLIHSPVKLIDLNSNDLGAVISRPKTITFDAAINPIHLSGVMGKTKLFHGLSFSQDPALDWYQGWLLFAQVLSTGVTSEYVEEGGAQHRVWNTPTLDLELQQHQAALDTVLDWIYASKHAATATPGFRQPPFTVAKRLREFSLFIWCLVSGNTHVCRSMMESAGLVAFLNTWLVKSIKDEIYLHIARQYQINLKTQIEQLQPSIKQSIIEQAISLQLENKAPSLLLAVCECLGIPYPRSNTTLSAQHPHHSPTPTARPFVLITTFRTNGPVDEVKNCAEILLENCSVPPISHVHVLLEGPLKALENSLQPAQVKALRFFLSTGKLVLFPIISRPYYHTLLGHANSLGDITAAIVNADMLLPAQTVYDIQGDRAIEGNLLYALTRWNYTATGEYLQGIAGHPPWPQWPPHHRCHFEKNYFSYDCYIFNTPIPIPAHLAEVSVATYGCDTAIAALMRLENYRIVNPCLSMRTLHKDEKLRDYLGVSGQQSLANNIEAFAGELLHKYAEHPAYASSLSQLHTLNKQTAWLGGPGNNKIMQTLFMIFGGSPWVKQHEYTPFKTTTIRIEDGSLESAVEILARIPQIITDDLFIIWELSGFGSEGGHIADLLVKHDHFEALGYPLFGYQRQAVLHQDIASPEAQNVLQNLCLMISELLSD